jgi:asparagine synthase (glutamine-hydrolysing)
LPGFIGRIGNGNSVAFSNEKRTNLLIENKQDNAFFIERRTINKFLNDKPFYEDENFLILVEGVVLNRKTLESNFGSDSFAKTIILAYKKHGEDFFNQFRGSFSGVFFDKLAKKWIIYTDQIGDKQIFYFLLPDGIVFGSEMAFVLDYLKKNDFNITLNLTGAYLCLTCGFMIEDHTLVDEIKKLQAGHYLKIDANNKVDIIKYHEFNNIPNETLTKQEAIEEIDRLFRNAVSLQFEKDIEYGYRHITTLSGGLDSRMTVWVAHELGFIDQLNTTFSQSNYLDETIAKQISTELNHDWLFKALDHGNFLKNIDDITSISYGGGNYFGLAHGKSLYDLIDFEKFGIMHTGQIGDAIVGTFFSDNKVEKKYSIIDGAYSTLIIDKIKNYKIERDYYNAEIFKLYTRAFTGANVGLLVFQEKTETCSPFLDVDFLSFCYSIPAEMRFNHKIYIEWILEKYPKAADYIWEKTNSKIEYLLEDNKINLFGRKIRKDLFFKWALGAVKRRLPFKPGKAATTKVDTRFHMTPIDQWYFTNDVLRNYLDSYYKSNIDLINNDDLKKDCSYLYANGNTSERAQVLTLLGAVKLIYS